VFSEQLPASIDGMMERAVGITLVALGAYVVVMLVRHGRDFRMRSRWMIAIVAARRAVRSVGRARASTEPAGSLVVEDQPPAVSVGVAPESRRVAAHRHRHPRAGAMPDDPFADYSTASAVGIGALHGIGAETPTQVVIFVGAAGATGAGAGVLLLACFIVGLLVSNTVVAAAATFGFVRSSGRFAVYATVSAITAGLSLAIGIAFLLGRGDVLPAIFRV
jgi:high-affinity nickel-transport protein